MKEYKGFLLIELMISLTILTITLCAYGHFFIYINKVYRMARNRLVAIQQIQNNIERSWLHMPTHNVHSVSTVHLPLPHGDIHLPDSGIQLVYKAFHIAHEAGVSIIPGYIYEV